MKVKQVSRRRPSCPWMTDGLIRSANRKPDLYKQNLNVSLDDETYKSYRNIHTMLIRKAKKNYFSHLFTAAVGDLKKTWRGIRMVLIRIQVGVWTLKLT